MTDLDRLRHFVELMNTRRYDEALAMVHRDVIIHEPPGIPYGGTFNGLEGFAEFRRLFSSTWDRWRDGPMWYAEAEGVVVKKNVITARSRATGREYCTRLAEFFRFSDGQIVEIEIFYQDVQAFLEAIS